MPKRKAASKLSGLVDSDLDDDELTGTRKDAPQEQDTETAPPPAKRPRGRPASSATTASAPSRAKPAASKKPTVAPGPKKQTTKTTTKTARKLTEAAASKPPAASTIYEDEYNSGDQTRADQGASEDEDELGSPEEALPTKKKPNGTRGPKGIDAGQATGEEELKYTPSRTQRGRPPAKARDTGRRPGKRRGSTPEPEEVEGEEDEEDVSNVENEMPTSRSKGTGAPNYNEHTSPVPVSSPSKSHRTSSTQFKKSGTPSQKKKTVRIDDAGDSDASLRRKLGDMTKKYENIEMKYRNLREVSVIEANANMEKLRKQCDAMTSASNELVASLKKELAAQTGLAQKSRTLQNQLKERDTEVSTLESRLEEMSSGLANAQKETKTLQNKLAASRNATMGAESSKGTNAARPTNARNNAASGHDTAQVAQLKEDLYCDLTGLIVRDVKQQDSQYLYDCIQTGLNGSLHFKLAVTHTPENATPYDEAEFHYSPLLDSNRDRELMDILPEYLGVDITFSRQNAAKFYSRVVDTLTKKQVEE